MSRMDEGAANMFGESYRNYDDSARQAGVAELYRRNHEGQTLAFARGKIAAYSSFDRASFTVAELIELLDSLRDESDPDTEESQTVHAYQTAEELRRAYPDQDHLHLLGLLHDLGKVLVQFDEPQWAVVGDTFPLGCAFAGEIVFADYFRDNPDAKVAEYSTPLGIYQEGCGLDALVMSWGHDEYMARVLENHYRQLPRPLAEGTTVLPEEAIYVLRYHSFYAWHTGGAYLRFESDKDRRLKPYVQRFQKCDLYSKTDDMVDVSALRAYYDGLLRKYNLDGKIAF